MKYYYNLKKKNLFEYIVNYNLFLWPNLNSQHHYSSLSVTWSFRNHYNILNISETFLIIINVENSRAAEYFCRDCDTFYFSGFFNEQSSKELNLFETEIFCNIINGFTVTFDQFKAFFQKEKKSHWPQTFECNDFYSSHLYTWQQQTPSTVRISQDWIVFLPTSWEYLRCRTTVKGWRHRCSHLTSFPITPLYHHKSSPV